MDSAVVGALQRGPGDLPRSLHHSLQAFVVPSRNAAVPHGDAAGQHALNNPAVEVAEDLRQHTKIPQPSPFFSVNISKGAFDMKFLPDVGNNPSNPSKETKSTEHTD